MKRILLLSLMSAALLLVLTCNISDPKNEKINEESNDAIEIILDDEIYLSDGYVLTSLNPTLDVTEVLTDTATITLLKETDINYPYEIINTLDWLSFSNLTGVVDSEKETITAYVDFKKFTPQEVKEGSIVIKSNNQSITLPVTAQNYFYSDTDTILEVDHNIFTIYNESDDELSFNISNSFQGGCMVYSFSSDEEWIEFDLPPGYLLGTETVDIPVFIDWESIEDKLLTRGYITVLNNLDPVQSETITIKARSEPELYVSKKTLTQKSNTNNSNTFEVGNILALSLPYTIYSDKDWVTLNKSSGSVTKGTNDIIEVSIDYTDFIENISKSAIIYIDSDFGNETINLTSTGYPSYKTSTVNIYMKSITEPTSAIEITNTGCGVSEYNLSTNYSFLSLSNSHGFLNHGESVEIIISTDFESLDWDAYTYGEIVLEINGEQKVFKVNAMREVDPEQDPRLFVNRSSINIDISSNTSEPFTIENRGTGSMSYSISVSDPWINVSSNSGLLTADQVDNLSLFIDVDLLGNDSSGYIQITSDGVYSNSHIINISVE